MNAGRAWRGHLSRVTLALQVADPDIKKAAVVTKWLGFGAQSLGPVQKKDGSRAEREVETWLPKKKVKAYSLR